MEASFNPHYQNLENWTIGSHKTISSQNEAIPSAACEQLLSLLGKARFLTGAETKADYANTTLPKSTTPAAVALPETRKEISDLLKIAANHELPVHTISRGKNWGYGDACAPTNGYLIVDLSRMNRICEINEQLAYAVIEPGVTQGQLASELRERGSRLMLDVTGAGPEASIVGNALQRGFGHTPYGDRTAHTCNYEVILPNGEMARTGFGNFANSKVGHTYPYGSGPSFQGMLAQGKQGIVTRMTIWLMPRPEVIEGFSFQTDNMRTFSDIVDAIGQLRQSRVIDSVVHLANDLRVFSTQPWMSAENIESFPLDPSQREAFRKRAGISLWNCLGGLYGTRGSVRAKKKDIQKALGAHCRIRFFGKRKIQLLSSLSKRMPANVTFDKLRNLSVAVTDVFDLLNGWPSPNHLKGAFFGNHPPSGKIIDAGLIWIAPVIPFTGHDVGRLLSAIIPIAEKYKFDLPVTISPVVPRAAICISNISFDKFDKAESERALSCYQQIQQEIHRLGYPPYRSSSISLARSVS